MGDLNWLPVLAATVANMIVGAIWYSNALFLPAWRRATGREPTKAPVAYVVSALAALMGAIVVAYIAGPDPTLSQSLTIGGMLGVLVALLSLAVNYSFAERGGGLLAIDGGFHVIRFLVIALVLGVWP